LIAGLLSANVLAAQHTMPAADPAMPPPAVSQPAAPAGSVPRAQFTSGIQDREPVDDLSNLTNDHTQVFFFTELKNLAGSRVLHRWEYNGQVMAEVPYEVGGDRWRVWSSKTLDPSWTGEWKVSVVDAAGSTLATGTFSYSPPAAQPAAEPGPMKQN